MDSQPHSNKQIILFALVAVVLILLSLFIAMMTVNSGEGENSEKEQVSQNNNDSVNKKQNGTNLQNVKPEDKKVIDGWKEYKSAEFSINYPPDWQLTELNLTGGVKGIGLKPIANIGNSSNIILTVSINDPAVQKLNQSEDAYMNMGFKRSTLTINNTKATKLFGTIPPKTGGSISPQQKYIYTGYVTVNHLGNSFLFDYSYVNTDVNKNVEDTITKIIASFN